MTDAPPRLARPVAYGLLAAMVVVAVLGVDAWPLTAFRLFSADRTDAATGWQVTVVAAGGAERPLTAEEHHALGRSFPTVLRRFGGRSPAGQRALCDSWRRTLRVETVLVSHVQWQGSALVSRQLATRCGAAP